MSSPEIKISGLSLGLHELNKINDPVAVAKLVVVPRDQLDEGGGQLDASLRIKDGRTVIPQEVSRDDHVLGVSKNTYTNMLKPNFLP